VAESKADSRNWLVRWDRRGAASDEECSTFKLKCEGPGSDLRPTNQEAAQQRSATQQQQAQPQGVMTPNAAVQDAAAAQQATTPPQQTTTTAPPPEQMRTTTTTAQQPQQAAVPLAETAVETVEETTARVAAEDANARTVDPDVPEEQDDRFDVANDFELHNPDDIAECDGDRHVRKWTHCALAKAAPIDDEVSVGAGARKITWKVAFDIKASDVDPVSSAEFPDVGVCDFDFATPTDTTKTTASGWKNPKKRKHRKQKKEGINFLCLLIHLWPGNWEDQLERMNERVEAFNQEQIQKKQNAGQRHKKAHEITKNEFWVFFGLMISARIHGRQGQLWDDEDEEPQGIKQPFNLGHHMLKCQFQEIKKFVPCMW
jgi:hypothetical protein